MASQGRAGTGKVKPVNTYRLTPGFGGFTPVPYATTECRLTCADAHKQQVSTLAYRLIHLA
ncbi:hypothetical protein DS043_17525 [Escherichia coli]|nr:hypothetical protein [Escherichia coli]EFP6925860.1 hypothetical protein [Shigella dysenteriae]EFO4690619.1 hypothetical protein [Escherichia coli]EFO4700309.1 hypothetical protein [Escherichia coli]EFP8428443.1 hypothetical protein [Shigella dysenteriae]